MELSPKINCLIGHNGMGKTNFLDAIYYLSFCRSANNPIDSQIILHDEAFFMLEGNYENDKFNLLSYMIFSLGNLAPIVTMWIAPKAYIAQLLAKGKTQDYVDQVMVPFTANHALILIGGTLMAALIGGYIAQNWLKKNK